MSSQKLASALTLVACLYLGPDLDAGREDYPLPEVLARMSRASEGLRTLKADLVQEKSYPQLGISDPPELGTLILKRAPSRLRLRLDITKPERRIVAVDGRSYIYYQPRLKQAFVGSLDASPSRREAGFLRYLLGDIASDDDYRVERGDATEDGTVHLKLVPYRADEVVYQRIELWVDTKLWLPVRQELVEANQSTTRIRLDSLALGLPLADELFDLELPRDVKRLKG